MADELPPVVARLIADTEQFVRKMREAGMTARTSLGDAQFSTHNSTTAMTRDVDHWSDTWVDANGRIHDSTTGRFVPAARQAGAEAQRAGRRVQSAGHSASSGFGRFVAGAARAARNVGLVTAAVGGLSALAPAVAGLGIPAAFAAIGIAAVGAQEKTNKAFKQSVDQIKTSIMGAFQPLVPILTRTMGQVAKVVQSLAPTFSAAATALGPFLTSLVGGLGQAARIALPAMVQAMAAAQPVFGALAAGLPIVARGFAALLRDLDFKGAAGVLGSLFKAIGQLLPIAGQLLNALMPVGKAVIGQLLPPVVKLVGVLVKALSPALAKMAPVFATIGKVVGQLADPLGQLISAIAPLIPGLAQVVVQLAEGLVPVIKEIAPPLTKLVSLVGAKTVKALMDLARAIIPILPQLGLLIVAVVRMLTQMDAHKTVLEVFVQALVKLMPSVVQLVPPLTQLVVALTPLMVMLADGAAKFAGFLTAMMPVETFILGLVGYVLKAFVGWVKLVVKWAEWLYDKLIGHSIIPDLINGIKKWFSWFGTLGKLFSGWWHAAVNAVSSEAKKIGDAAGGIKTKVENAFSGAWKWLTSAGANIVIGLWNGIAGKGSWLFGQVRQFASNIVGSFESWLGIHSPSRVMADRIGQYIPAGIAQGITANLGKVTAAARNAATATVRGAQAAITAPAARLAAGAPVAGAGGGGNIHIVLNADGKKLYELIVPHAQRHRNRNVSTMLA